MRRDVVAPLVFWIVFLSLVVFTMTHTSWYDQWPLGERINFWVAAGTGALAIVTAASVLATMRVISSEDRRHREGLAPICVAYFTRADIHVQNIGLGPAVDVVVTGRVEYDKPIYERPLQSDTPNAAAAPFTAPSLQHVVGRDFGARRFQTAIISVLPAVKGQPEKWDANGFHMIEAGWATPPDVDSQTSVLRDDLLYATKIGISDVCVSYADMFGNRYETQYADIYSNRYLWVRPLRYV